MLRIKVIAIYTIIFFQMLDSSIVNLLLYKVSIDLGFQITNASIIITSFGIGLCISLPLFRYFSHKVNQDVIFSLGALAFVLSSLLIGLSDSKGMFVAARILQGTSSGAIILLSQVMLAKYLNGNQVLATSIWVSAISFAPLLGPILGAYVAEFFGWRLLFIINVPIILICLIITFEKPENIMSGSDGPKFGWLEFALFGIFIICLQYVVDNGEHKNWFSSNTINLCVFTGLSSFFVLLLLPQRTLFNYNLMKNFRFSAITSIIAIGNGINIIAIVLLPIWMQSVLGYSLLYAGLVIAAGSLFTAVISPLIGNYIQSYQRAWFFGYLSILLGSISFVLIAFVTPDSNQSTLWLSRIVAGCSLAMFSTSLTSISINGLKPDQIVDANAINMSLRVILTNLVVGLSFFLYKKVIDQNYYTSRANVSNGDNLYPIESQQYYLILRGFFETDALNTLFTIFASVFFIFVFVMLLALKYDRNAINFKKI